MSSTPLTNHQVRLAAPPRRRAHRATTGASPPSRSAEPAEGGVLVKTLALSLDPAMRGWMNEGKSYIAPVGIGEVMRAGGIGARGRLEATRRSPSATRSAARSACRNTRCSRPTRSSAAALAKIDLRARHR